MGEIRVSEDWVILVDEERFVVARDTHEKEEVMAGALVCRPKYMYKGYYSTLHSAVNGVCSYMTLAELAEHNYSLTEALQVTHDLYTMVNDSIKEALRAKG